MKKKIKLTAYEKEILDAYQKGKLKRVKNFAEEASMAVEYARNTLKKDKRINIRISSSDFNGIRQIAADEGLPYQSLISSVLHKYVANHK